MHFEASEGIITKFKSQGLYTIRIKFWNASGSGSPPSLIPSLCNIGILLHKQATWIKHFCPECTSLFFNSQVIIITQPTTIWRKTGVMHNVEVKPIQNRMKSFLKGHFFFHEIFYENSNIVHFVYYKFNEISPENNWRHFSFIRT